MPRQKKQRLKQRKDGRYRCKYHDLVFYGSTEAEALEKREAYKAGERKGFHTETVSGYALPWLERSFPAVADTTYEGLAIHLQHLVDNIGDKRISEVVPSDIKAIYSAHYNGLSNSYIKAARQIPLLPPLKTALKGRTGPLVTSAHGEQINPTTWRVLWQSYRASMETAINGTCKRWYGKKKSQQGKALPAWIDFDIVPYDLRHSFCVMCRDSGVEINTCRKWLGHADSKMILQVYDSVSEDRTEQERKKLLRVRFGIQENAGASESIEK